MYELSELASWPLTFPSTSGVAAPASEPAVAAAVAASALALFLRALFDSDGATTGGLEMVSEDIL